MELFVIQCTTCRARLKVHDPALVGLIVECPKCSSFVHVTPPAGWQAPAPAALPTAGSSTNAGRAASRGITASAPGESSASHVLPAVEPARRGAAADSQSLSAIRSAAAAPAENSSVPVAGKSAARPAAAAVGKAPAAAPPPLPAARVKAGAQTVRAAGTASLIVPEPAGSAGPLAQLVARARQHYWISSASLVGLVVIVTIAWAASRSNNSAPPHTASAAVSSAAGAQPGGDSVAGERISADPADRARAGEAANDSDPGDRSASGADPSRADDEPQKDDAQAGSAQPDVDEANTEQAGDADRPRAAGSEQAERKSRPVGSAASIPALPADPLDPIVRALASEPDPLPSINPGLSTARPRSRSAKGDSAADALSDSESGGADEQPDTEAQARLAAHLQDRIEAMEFKDVPLGQFVAFLSDYSTVPMTIDSESLLEVGKGAKTKITVKLPGGTVEEALKAALVKPGLAFRLEPKQIVITAGKPKR